MQHVAGLELGLVSIADLGSASIVLCADRVPRDKRETQEEGHMRLTIYHPTYAHLISWGRRWVSDVIPP